MQEVSYRTNAHILPGTYALVLVLMNAGMLPMFIAIWLGASVGVSMAALILPMILMAAIVTGPADYQLNATGLKRTISPYLLSALFGYRKREAYTWNQVAAYKHGSDMNRSREEYEFLELQFKPRGKWMMTDQQNKEAFSIFRDAFLQAVEQWNTSGTLIDENSKPANASVVKQPEAASVTESLTATPAPRIERKKTFYETGAAKVYYWLMALIVSGILAFMWVNGGEVGYTSAFRVSFVILPGMAYLFYRLYGKKK